MDGEYLTVAEIAERLKLNQQTIRNWIDQGKLPAVRIGARRVRVRADDLERFIIGDASPNVDPVPGDEITARKAFSGALEKAALASGDAELVVALSELAKASTALVQALSSR